MNPHIEKAVSICGSQVALARGCGVTQGAVWKWLHGGTISAEKAVSVESATRGSVTRHDLRPDIFGVVPEGGAGDEA